MRLRIFGRPFSLITAWESKSAGFINLPLYSIIDKRLEFT